LFDRVGDPYKPLPIQPDRVVYVSLYGHLFAAPAVFNGIRFVGPGFYGFVKIVSIRRKGCIRFLLPRGNVRLASGQRDHMDAIQKRAAVM
jgi:hypothetical protein